MVKEEGHRPESLPAAAGRRTRTRTAEVAELEQKLRELDSRIRVLNRAVLQTMNDTLALWDVMLDLRRKTEVRSTVEERQ